jgi:hypothetical protein
MKIRNSDPVLRRRTLAFRARNTRKALHPGGAAQCALALREVVDERAASLRTAFAASVVRSSDRQQLLVVYACGVSSVQSQSSAAEPAVTKTRSTEAWV